MSYILDSLKKSEQQRKQLEQPGLHSEPIGAASRRRNERRWWPYLLLIALLLNASLLGWYLLADREEGGVEVVAGKSIQPADAPREQQPVSNQVAPPVDAADAMDPATLQRIQRQPVPALQIDEPAREETAVANPVDSVAEPTPYTRLSESLRQELPEMTLSLHYFSGNSHSSMVRLNGRILRVGDSLVDGLSVAEITADGVILDYRGRRIWLARPRG
jgi:general secretion pathway protein B